MNKHDADEGKTYSTFDHDQYARTRPAGDFWGQIRRTVNGEAVSEQQIGMIVDAIKQGLDLTPADTLLDLACGNGALSRRLFDSCREFVGADLSEYLIGVAKQHHEQPPHYQFMHCGAAPYARLEAQPQRFSKVLCYGSFSYFSAADAAEVLALLFTRFSGVQKVFIGNLPDRDRLRHFYRDKQPGAGELADHTSQIGIWRTQEEFAALAAAAGWRAAFSTLPPAFYAAHYRYDVLLSR